MQLPLSANTQAHIAIFRLSALGDLVLVSAIVPQLQQAFPDAHISWITSELGESTLQGLPGVEFIVIPKPRNLKSFNQARQILRGYNFDVLLCLQASLTAHLLYPLISAKLKLGFDNQRAKDGHKWFVHQQIDSAEEHLADGFCRFVAALSGKSVKPPHWHLPVPESAYNWAGQQLAAAKLPVALVLSTSKTERDWPLPRYIELTERLQHRHPHCTFVLIGGNSELEHQQGKILAESHRKNIVNLIGKTSPKQLAALLSHCQLLISPDTGPVHIAVAVNTPVVGLYAVARPALTGPYNDLHSVVDKYPKALEKYCNTSLDNSGWHQRVHHPDAMAMIEVDEVLTQCLKVLQSQTQ